METSFPEIGLLDREGLLVPVLPDRASEVSSSGSAAKRLADIIFGAIDNEDTEVIKELLSDIRPAFNSGITCFSDIQYLIFWQESGEKLFADLINQLGHDVCSRLYFHRYLLQVAAASEQMSATACSWTQEFQNALWATRRMYAEPSASGGSAQQNRERVAFDLAHQILERQLPRADDLPLEELLRIRQKRADELESFRVALRALTAEIDPEDTPARIRAATEQLITTKIDPALDDLRRALRASRMDVFRSVGRSSASLAGATISASLMLAGGAPVDLAALLAATGGLVGSAVDSVIDREHTIRASQWGLLVRLR